MRDPDELSDDNLQGYGQDFELQAPPAQTDPNTAPGLGILPMLIERSLRHGLAAFFGGAALLALSAFSARSGGLFFPALMVAAGAPVGEI